MTTTDIRELFAYNDWANRKTFASAAQVPAEQYMLDLKSSHGGLHGTLVHMVGAERIWHARWTDAADKSPLKPETVASLADLVAIWETVNSGIQAFIAPLTEAKLSEIFTVTSLKGDRLDSSFHEMLQHLANHSTYHRGQAAGMIRQFGFKPESTDMIRYYREKRVAAGK